MWNQTLPFSNSLPGITVLDSDLLPTLDPGASPEKRLLLAVLEQGIRDFLDKGKGYANQAKWWLFDDIEADFQNPFTCAWICKELDIDIRSLRSRVEHFSENGVPKEMVWVFKKQA